MNNGPTWFERFPLVFQVAHLLHRAVERWQAAEQLRCSMIVELRKPGA